MPLWNATLDVKESWQRLQDEDGLIYEDGELEKFCKEVADKLEKINVTEDQTEDRDEFVSEFRRMANDPPVEMDEFNFQWNELYDWADRVRLWIKTF